MNSQKLERIYVAALSRIEATEPGAEARKSTPIFLRNSDASKKEAIRDAANALGNLWMRKGCPLSKAVFISVSQLKEYEPGKRG